MIDPRTIPDEMIIRPGKGHYDYTENSWEIYIKDSRLSESDKAYLLNTGEKAARKDKRCLELLDEIAEGIDGLPQEVLDYLKPNEKEQQLFIERRERAKREPKIGIPILIALNAVVVAIAVFLIGIDSEGFGPFFLLAVIPDAIFFAWLDSCTNTRAFRFDEIHTVSSKYKRYDTVYCPFCHTDIFIRYIYFDDIAKKPCDYQGNPMIQCPNCGKMVAYSGFHRKYLDYDEYRRKYLI